MTRKPRSCGAGVVFAGSERVADQRNSGGKNPFEEKNHGQDERPDVFDDHQKEVPRKKESDKDTNEIQERRQHCSHRLS